jgi:hypothetical protein
MLSADLEICNRDYMRLILILGATFALAGCNTLPTSSDYALMGNLVTNVDQHLLGGKVSKSFYKLGSTIADTISPDETDKPLPQGYWDDLTLVSLDHLCERATLAYVDGRRWAYSLEPSMKAMKELDRRKEDCGLPPRIYPQ